MKKLFLFISFLTLSFSFNSVKAVSYTNISQACSTVSGEIVTYKDKEDVEVSFCQLPSGFGCTLLNFNKGECTQTSFDNYKKTLDNKTEKTCDVMGGYFWYSPLSRCSKPEEIMKYIDAADSSTVKSTTTNNLFSFFNFFKKSTTTDNFIINISTTTPFVKDIYTSGLKVLSSTTVKLNTEKTVISKLNSEICDSSSFSIIKIGANGSKVKELQSFLIRDKYLLIDTPTEYFGLKTQGAVKAFQLKNNVAPALGNFGEITKKVYCELIKTVN